MKRLSEGAVCSKGMGLLGGRLGGWSAQRSGRFTPGKMINVYECKKYNFMANKRDVYVRKKISF
jgi:hypothetical protein